MSLMVGVTRAAVATADKLGLPLFAKIRSGSAKGLRIGLRNASRAHLQGSYERPLQRTLERCLHPGDIFLDIGSNIGFFSLIAARLVGPAGRVFAVEPVPENARCIANNARLNRFENVSPLEAAVGRTRGRGCLMLARHPGGATLSRIDAPKDSVGSLSVETTTIDHLLASGRIDAPTLVKIDVEGTEIDVLEGMRDTLSTCQPKVAFEVDAATQQEAEAKFEIVDVWMRAQGYAIERLEPAYPDLQWAVIHGFAAPTTIDGR